MKNTLSQQNCNEQLTRVYVCRLPDFKGAQQDAWKTLQDKFTLQLLRFAYQNTFGKSLDSQNPRRLPNGKPTCDSGYLSLSHSGNFVAVALSKNAVGVDLQKCTSVNMHSIAYKLFTSGEKIALDSAENFTDCFFFTWCKKEALWKSLNIQPPTIAAVDTTLRQFTQQKLTLAGQTFYLAVTNCATVEILSDEMAENFEKSVLND